MPSPTAIHEATHAAVALDLGLRVREVRLKGWILVPRYCAQLYPGLVTGMPIKTPACLLEDDCLDENPFEVLVSMAAPGFFPTDDRKTNTYAGLEYMIAMRHGRKLDLSTRKISAEARRRAATCEPRIYEIAAQLEQEGVIDGGTLAGVEPVRSRL